MIPGLLIAVFVHSGRPASVAETLASVRQASGIERSTGCWEATGTATLRGAPEKLDLVFDSGARFVVANQGDLPETDGFDGRSCWTALGSGAPHRLWIHGRDTTLLPYWVALGDWADPRSGVTVETLPGEGPDLHLRLRIRGSVVTATLTVDACTHLPKSLTYWSETGGDTWSFGSYRTFDCRTLPTRVSRTSGAQVDVYDIQAVSRLATTPRFQMPAPDRSHTVFDPAADPLIETRFFAGHMFVRPKIDGQQAGWFFLDSGADAMCLAPTYAKKIGAKTVGFETVSGAVAVSKLDICRTDTMALGPLTIKNPIFYQLADLDQIGKMMGLEIDGIIGYDFISRVTLDVDPTKKTVRALPPGSFILPAGGTWTPIVFATSTPMINASFAEGSGIFALDTGSGETVDFFTPAVKKYRLFNDASAKKARTGGAGGFADSRQDTIAWFQMPGLRIEKPTVGLQLSDKGDYASPYFTGNIGSGFMSRFRMIFDYQKERVAFLPLSSDPAPIKQSGNQASKHPSNP